MNQQNAAQFLPLIQALAEGKTIQILHPTRDTWESATNPDFTYSPESYRIKPELREWKASIGNVPCSDGFGKLYAYDDGDESDYKYRVIRVREILD